MIQKKLFIHFICTILLSTPHLTMITETSETMRPTDIIYKKTEADNSKAFKYQDFTIKGTQSVIQASVPEETFLSMPIMASALVTHPKDPKSVVLVKQLNKKLALPGGYINYAEDPLIGAARKFSEKVHFHVGEDTEEESTKQAGLTSGLMGMVTMNTLKKGTSPFGPFFGVFGVGDRNTKRPNMLFVYNFIIGDDFVKPVLGNEASLDVMYCDIVKILARNLDAVTDKPEEHPLKPLAEQLKQEDAEMLENANQDGSQDLTLGELEECQQEFCSDFLLVINRYYLRLVSFHILNENGELLDIEGKKAYFYNKTKLIEKSKKRSNEHGL